MNETGLGDFVEISLRKRGVWGDEQLVCCFRWLSIEI